jgi:hypothetical protein
LETEIHILLKNLKIDSFESWDSIFDNNDNMDVNSLFNIFLNNYLRIVYTSFLLQKIIERGKNRQWITTDIKTSCNRKRQLNLLNRDSSDISLIKYCKQYCKILARVITEVKRSKYNNQIINSTYKMKTTWNIIKPETNRLKGHTVSNYENSPNDNFLSIAEKVMQSIKHSDTEDTSGKKKPMYCLSKISHNPFPNIKFSNTLWGEVSMSGYLPHIVNSSLVDFTLLSQ